jgi:hypothetical protein
MAITTTYYTSGTFSVSASKTIDVSCWGAGGDGNANGTGGSGGAYVGKTFTVQSGSYTVNVGQPNADGFGNGGVSNFISASVIVVQAGGGRSDGTITGQSTFNTGSTKYTGGTGGTFSGTYGNYGGAGGGSAAGGVGNGAAGENGADTGASFPQFGHSLTGSLGASGGTSGGGDGGNAAYYDAGPCSRIIPATNGVVPGGGGGGGYSGESNVSIKTEGTGGAGMVTITW